MFARAVVLSLASSLVVSRAVGLDLDVGSQDSIKGTASTLASSIIAAYNDSLSENRIPGLFPEDKYFWWESGVVINSLITYSYLTGDLQYTGLLSEGMQWQLGDFDAFQPVNQTTTIGNDDQSFWALAAMTAAEVDFPKPENGTWLEFARNAFDLQVLRQEIEEASNGTCGGGLRWQIFQFNFGYEYKNAMSNGNFFLLAARLAKFTGNQTYSAWAEKSYTWAREIGLVDENYAVYDGTSTTSECKQMNRLQFTANHGFYTEGAAIMYNLTNGNQEWTSAIRGFANSSSIFLENDVLVEVACEKNGRCDTDQRAFKGVAARSYARAAVQAPIVADTFNKVLEASAKAVASACNGSTDVECRFRWTENDSEEEAASAKNGNLGEVFNALEVVQGLLYKTAPPVTTGNGTATESGKNNATQSGDAAAPNSTGSAGSIAASVATVLAIAFAAALSF